jgi:hypothetical protein
MAVTKEVYTATATWTAITNAAIFRDAFTDAGLMTDWYDSFTSSGLEHRILEVVYSPSKTNGTTYYWFIFNTSNVYLQTAGGWNAVTHVPTGTQYLDYFSTTTTSVSNHNDLSTTTLSTSTQATLTRYTSGISSGCSWFMYKNGTNMFTFTIPSPTFGPASWVDLDYYRYNYIPFALPVTSGNTAALTFIHRAGNLRTSIFGATITRNSTTSGGYTNTFQVLRFAGAGNAGSGNTSDYLSAAATTGGIPLPVAMSNTNTRLAANHVPVFTSPPINPYTANQPADIGITLQYSITSAAEGDTYVVSAGVEEYEIIAKAGTNTSGYAQIFLLARTV